MLFPITHKAKISSKYSYPIGAELISTELADVPQAANFEISFHAKYETMKTRHQPYEILRVFFAESRFLGNPGWGIQVYPVPRTLRHEIKTALRSEFFPPIRKWLHANADRDGGFEGRLLSVVFDEYSETLLKLKQY